MSEAYLAAYEYNGIETPVAIENIPRIKFSPHKEHRNLVVLTLPDGMTYALNRDQIMLAVKVTDPGLYAQQD